MSPQNAAASDNTRFLTQRAQLGQGSAGPAHLHPPAGGWTHACLCGFPTPYCEAQPPSEIVHPLARTTACISWGRVTRVLGKAPSTETPWAASRCGVRPPSMRVSRLAELPSQARTGHSWPAGARWERCSFQLWATILEGPPSKTTASSCFSPFSALCCSSFQTRVQRGRGGEGMPLTKGTTLN